MGTPSPGIRLAVMPNPYAQSPYTAYPGYSDNGGAPTIIEGGAVMPLVLFGGEWGYHDSERRWHRAPEGVSRHLEERGGGQFHPNAAPRGEAFPQPRQDGRPSGERFCGQAANRPAEHPRPAATPVAAAPAPAAQPRQEGHERHRDCPAGQRC